MTIYLYRNTLAAFICVLILFIVQIDAKSRCPRHQYNQAECQRIRYIPCATSADCSRGRICCYNGCGLACRLPQKPGFCPAPSGVGICAFMCRTDQQCEGNMKCCRTGCGGTTCSTPIFPTEKPGRCPSGNIVCIQNVCSHDSDCPGRQKCCNNGCRCANPKSRDHNIFLDELSSDDVLFDF